MNNESIKLPLDFEPQQLQQDLDICEKSMWSEHFNTSDYAGSWKSIALRSASGKPTDIYAHPGDTNFKNTPLLDTCAYFQEILDQFHFEKESVRLLCLMPGSQILEHSDPGLAYQFGSFRLHIPIITDPEVDFIVGGNLIPMKSGECWYANFQLPHSVKHNGTSRRVHLVIDGKRNAWTDQLFKQGGYDVEAENTFETYDSVTRKEIIENLSLLDTPIARSLILKLSEEPL
jgi:hypothetical protein